MKEFLTTEVTYVENLEMMEKYFIKPIEQLLLKDHPVSKCLRQFVSIKGINNMFLDELKEFIKPDEQTLYCLGGFSKII